MTVDELIAKLRKMKRDKKITGKEAVVTDFYDMESLTAAFASHVETKIIKRDHEHPWPWSQPIARIIDGRGNPSGSEKVVRII